MRAMRAPISCFTNKKIVVSKWHGFFYLQKNAHYTYNVLIYNHRKEINKVVVKIEEKVVITNSSEAKNLNENEYFTAYFNDVKYGMTDYYEDLDGNGAAEVVQRAEIMRRRRDTNPCVFSIKNYWET